jgi:hypothetical protein
MASTSPAVPPTWPSGVLGERHVHQGFDGLPGPLRQQVRGQQPAHALVLILHRG